MDLKDQRIGYAIAAVIIVLIIIGYATGWFGGVPARHPSSKLHRRMQKDQSPVGSECTCRKAVDSCPDALE